jgi:alanyl-tRNA synthetase
MTERLYYHDSYLRQFEARVVKAGMAADGYEVVLDSTAFYPTSGGQPHDLGVVAGARVREVAEREGEIVHCLESPVAEERVECAIDWARRFDHMQQHTGQHVLSQAFIRAGRRNTVGFHMGDDYATIDLDAENIGQQQLSEAERLANTIIYENRPIAVRIVPEAEVPVLGLRKESQRTGPLRVVSVEDFDVSACGGTHVRRTGEIGSIVIRKVERVNRQARVEFVCGRRALIAGQRDLESLSLVARQFSVGLSEVPARVEKQVQEARQLRKALQVKNKLLAGLLAKELYAEAAQRQGCRIVKQLFADEELEFLKLLAQALLSQGSCVVLLGSGGAQAALLLFAQSDGLPGDLRQILPECCRLIEGKGGGTRTLVQAGGKNASQLQPALDLAEQRIMSGSSTSAL